MSEEEFAGRVWPDTGVDEIIWCPIDIGPFKKVLYTMEKYPDCPVISVDDDIDYGCVVDALWDLHEKYPNDVITNFPNVKTGGLRLTNGYATLYPPHCLDGAFGLLTRQIVATKNDDAFYGLGLAGLGSAVREDMWGWQVALGANFARRVHGLQTALCFNMTEELRGAQIGLVNYASTCSSGFQLGLVNFIMDNQIPVLPIFNCYFFH
jgi:hypothetical protein